MKTNLTIRGISINDKFLDENGRSWVVIDFRESKSLLNGSIAETVYCYNGSVARHFSYETVKEGLTN